MASDVSLVIVDPRRGAVVYERWIGMGAVRDELRAVLTREPDHRQVGMESWGRITASEARALAEHRYADGLSQKEVAELAGRLPDSEYWWIVSHDY